MQIEKQTFLIGDYIVFSVTVLLSVAIGVYFAFAGKGKNTTVNYFLGDRKLKYGPVALSLVVTFQSSIMMLGFPAEVYLFGYMICLFNLGQCAAIFVSSRIIVPLMYPLKITSVYNYLKLRFNSNAVRLLTVIIGIISQCSYMGVVLFGPAIALQSVTDLPAWASVLCIAAAAALYTSIGGIVAVVWTDVVQCVIIIIGIIAILIKGSIDSGGLGYIYETNLKSGRLDIFDFNPDPRVRHTFWTIMAGSFIGSFSLTLSQSTIQRFNSTPNIKSANKVLFLAGPIFIFLQIMSMSVGLVCYAYYTSKGCDPLLAGHITNPNQIVPFMIVDIFSRYEGLSGLFISALFSASLSTLSSILAGLSAVTIEDLIKPYSNFSDKTLTLFAKLLVVLYGGIGVAVAFMISKIKGSLTQILFSIMGAATGPSVGIFFLAMFYPKSTSKGVFIGGLVGLVLTFWICIGATVSPTLPKPTPLPLAPTDMCISPTIENITYKAENISYYTSTSLPYSVTLTNALTTLRADASMVKTETGVSGIDSLYNISYALFSTIGTLITISVGLVASLVTYDDTKDRPDPRYMLPLFDQLCCCFPRKWLKNLRCGVDYKARDHLVEDEETSRLNGVSKTDENTDKAHL